MFSDKISYAFLLIIFLSGCIVHESAKIPLDILSEGDIVFRKGNSMKTQAVLQADTSGIYSHIGIVVKTDSCFMVVHITPGERAAGETVDKIKLEHLERFFSSELAKKGAIARFRDSLDCSNAAAKYAFELCKQNILFDHDYDLEDTTKMYCTELVWHVYQRAGRDISNKKRSYIYNFPMFSGVYIFPSDIYKNEQLEIYYEF